MVRKSISVLVILLMVIFCVLTCRQNRSLKTQIKQQSKEADILTHQIESNQSKSNLVSMNRILTKVEKELKSTDSLSYSTIKSIADLSQSFKPFHYLKGDSLTQKKWSPERGQLLLALTNMDIDTSDLFRIFFKVSFANSDLAKADLRGAFLKGIDLEGANLEGADMRQINLEGANLSDSNFWGAKMNGANLKEANCKRTVFDWVEMNESNLQNAEFHDASLNNIKLRNSNLKSVKIKYADMKGAIVNGSNMEKADLFWIDFSLANLSNTNLKNSDLKGANLSETILSKADLTNSRIIELQTHTKDWFKYLRAEEVVGIIELEKKYKIEKQNENGKWVIGSNTNPK